MTNRDIRVLIIDNVAIGSDIPSITPSTILYYFLKNPVAKAKLREKMNIVTKAGTISDPITLREAQALPYLQAVFKESVRIHSATGFIMPGTKPKEGKRK